MQKQWGLNEFTYDAVHTLLWSRKGSTVCWIINHLTSAVLLSTRPGWLLMEKAEHPVTVRTKRTHHTLLKPLA